MNLSSTATELCSDVLRQSFGVTAGHIYIQILICLKFIQHIVYGNLDITIFFINYFCGELDLINEKVELLIFLFGNKVLDIFTENDWISEFIVTSLIQFNFNDMILLNSL